jgi:hypothetical protein
MQTVALTLPEQGVRVRGKKHKGNPNWVKGHTNPGPGRPKGVPDKFTREIKPALLDAVEYVGEAKADEFFAALKKANPKTGDPDKLYATLSRVSAYLVWIANDYPQVACAMLARMMPQQVQAEHRVEHTYHSLEEIANRLRELGLPAQRIYPLIEAKKADNATE